MLAALLALGASFTWGSSNYLAGVETRRRSVWTVTAVSQIVAVAGAAVVLAIDRRPPPDFWHTLGPTLGGVAGAIGVVTLYSALAIGTMSIVSPIIATQALVPVIVGLALGERPGLLAYLGMALAISGVVLVSWKKRSDAKPADKRAILLAVITAICFGAFLVGMDVGGHADPYWSVFDARVTSVVVVLAYVLLTRRSVRVPWAIVPALASVGLLLTVANVCFTVASTLGFLSIVSILGSLSPVVTTGYAQVLLNERLAARQWCGVATVFAGIALLSL
jgi:drug/metabolite transporter (DMT)-like permease